MQVGSLPITASPCDAIHAVVCVSIDPAVAIAADYHEHYTETETAATQTPEDAEPALMADGEYQDAAYYDSWERAELEINQFAVRAKEAEEELERQQLQANKKEHHLRGSIGDAVIDLVAKGSTTERGTHFSAGNQYMLQDHEVCWCCSFGFTNFTVSPCLYVNFTVVLCMSVLLIVLVQLF